MAKTTCSIEGCDGEILARGWCSKHYSRWYSHGDPEKIPERGRPPAEPREPAQCSIEDCESPADTRGWCTLHYSRWLRKGDPLAEVREYGRNGTKEDPKQCEEEGCGEPAVTRGRCHGHYRALLHSERGECSVEGCTAKWHADGLCSKHYSRQRSWGTTDDKKPQELRGSCSVDGCGGPVKARSWCGMHLRRWYKWGTTDLPERAKTRTCNRCGQRFPLDQFTGTVRVCITCWPHWRQELRAKELSDSADVRRSAAALRAEQQGKCAICGIAEADAPRKRLHLDHDHQSGAIRGLLCTTCNTGLGMFKDDPKRLAAAITYLQATMPPGQLTLFAA